MIKLVSHNYVHIHNRNNCTALIVFGFNYEPTVLFF